MVSMSSHAGTRRSYRILISASLTTLLLVTLLGTLGIYLAWESAKDREIEAERRTQAMACILYVLSGGEVDPREAMGVEFDTDLAQICQDVMESRVDHLEIN